MKILCFRCKGSEKIYKIGAAYTSTNSGGVEVICPLCLGKGKIEKFEPEKNVSKKRSKREGDI